MKRLLPVLVVVALLLVACGDDVTVRVAPRSIEYFSRARDFMATAAVLLNESRPLWGQSIRALYYAAFSIARAKDLDGLLAADGSVHGKVWGQAKIAARPFFHDTLKGMRDKWDYEVREEFLTPVAADLVTILEDGPASFAVLIADARDAVQRQTRYCTAPKRQCDRCRSAAATSCEREAALSRLREVEIDVNSYFQRDIPAALDRANAAP